MSSIHQNNTSRGFTLVEMLVVAPIILLVIAAFIGILVNLTGEVLVARSSNSLAYNTQSALTNIEQDIRLSGSYLATNNINLSTLSPQGYDNGTQNFSNASTTTGNAIILNSVATTGTSNQADRQPVWLQNAPNSCGSGLENQNQPMTYNVIYFIKDNTLWRRAILPPGYATKGCSLPEQRPSCQPTQTAAICVARDTKLLDNVSSFTIQYYPSAGSTTPYTTAVDASQPAATRQVQLGAATTVKVDITATQKIAGRDISYSGTIRASRIGSVVDYVTP